VRVFSKLFRGLMLAKLLAAHEAGQLPFFNQYAHLAERKAFARYLAPLRRRKWYVYSKRPFGRPKAVLAYLSRYTDRVAISNRQLIAFDQNGVTFIWPSLPARKTLRACELLAVQNRKLCLTTAVPPSRRPPRIRVPAVAVA
jgi:hypothetical protein